MGQTSSFIVFSLIILESVTSIGNYVFSDCKQLQNVKLPASIKKVGVSTFANEWKTIEDNENSEVQENSTEKESEITDNA